VLRGPGDREDSAEGEDRAVRAGRVRLAQQVTVLADELPDGGAVFVEIKYRVRATNTFYNLVYPFYVIPHDAE